MDEWMDGWMGGWIDSSVCIERTNNKHDVIILLVATQLHDSV